MLPILTQMLPLLVFIVVDMIFTNTAVSIVSAILFAIFQMVFAFIKTGTPDYLILIDVALISGLGAVSIYLKNDIFFKLKPAIIEGIVTLLVTAMIFAPDHFIISYFSRFVPAGMSLQPGALPMIKKMFVIVNIYTLFHIGAIYYTATHCSRKTWALISGPGYFFIFIPLMVVILLKKLRTNKKFKH